MDRARLDDNPALASNSEVLVSLDVTGVGPLGVGDGLELADKFGCNRGDPCGVLPDLTRSVWSKLFSNHCCVEELEGLDAERSLVSCSADGLLRSFDSSSPCCSSTEGGADSSL